MSLLRRLVKAFPGYQCKWGTAALFPPSSSLHRKCQMMCRHRKSLKVTVMPTLKGQMCMSKTWLWFCGWLRQLTLFGASVKQGRPLSLPPVWEARERRLFLHEYPAQECRVELLAAVIASSCGRFAYRPSLPSCVPAFSPPARGTTGGPGLGNADIIALACAMLSGSWESDATGGQWGGGDHHVTTQEVDGWN